MQEKEFLLYYNGLHFFFPPSLTPKKPVLPEILYLI